MAAKKESKFSAWFTTKLKENYQGCFIQNNHGNAYVKRGIPDIYMWYAGEFYAFELKTVEGKIRKLQTWTLEQIRLNGFIAMVVIEKGDMPWNKTTTQLKEQMKKSLTS